MRATSSARLIRTSANICLSSVGHGSPTAVPVRCGLPRSARAYALNITVVPRADLVPSPVEKVSILVPRPPIGFSQPIVTPFINSPDGMIVAKHQIAFADTQGDLFLHSTDETHLLLDINGYWAEEPLGLVFQGFGPCPILDVISIPAQTVQALDIGASLRCGGAPLPDAAGAYALRFTVIPENRLGYLAAWPSSLLRDPGTSLLHSLDGSVVSNIAILTNVNGWIDVYASDTTLLQVEVLGYYVPRTR
jgi:hypothetical protein